MEAERTIKRRRKITGRRLLVGDQVEVFSTDEGLFGSWHGARVLEVGDCSRLIEYNHFLTEDKCSKLVERISVSEAIEGLSKSVSEENRGSIRPVPPSCNFPVSEIRYGLCVDAWVQDAWWEGVVFDCSKDSHRRKVFFPDLGDQREVAVNRLRITQEWNEVSGHWKPRGEWLLLEVLQVLEKEGPLPVSTRQIWYDLRATVAFWEQIGSWISGSQIVWYSLVSELIQELLAIVNHQPAAEMSHPHQLMNADCGVITNLLEDTPCLETMDGQEFADLITGVVPDEAAIIHYPELDIAHDHPLPENADGDLHSSIKSDKYSDNVAQGSEAKDNFNSRVGKLWKPVEYEAECYRDAIELCARGLAKSKALIGSRHDDIRLQVRKHLVALGWKIECKRDTMVRFRYFSPDGKVYYSLHTACCYLMDKQQNEDHAHGSHLEARVHPEPVFCVNKGSQSMQKAKHHGEHSSGVVGVMASKEGVGLELSYTEGFGADSTMVDSDSLLRAHIFYASQPEFVEKEQDIGGQLSIPHKREMVSCSSKWVDHVNLHIEPEDIPEAPRDYCDYMVARKNNLEIQNVDAKLLQLRAKKHLKFMGWELMGINRAKRYVVSYCSPDSKLYQSLHTACKAYVESIPESIYRSAPGFSKRRRLCGGLSTSKTFEKFVKKNPRGRRSTMRKCDDYHEDLEALDSSGGNESMPSSTSSESRGNDFWRLGPRRLRKANKRKGTTPQFLVCQRQKSKSNFPPHVLRTSKRAQPVASSPGQHIARTVLSSLIDNDIVLPRQKVSYIQKRDGRVLMQGWITRYGIMCNCCQKVFTLSSFEAHAGSTSHRPAANIFLQDGRSLLQCQAYLMQTNKSKSFPHMRSKCDYSKCTSDAICSICQDGGTLVLCDLCPSAFHLDCVGLKVVPEGDWFCHCCRCSICGMSDFNSDTKQFTEKTILYCDQCEREYHVGCLRESATQGLRNCPTGDWFCSIKCSKIFSQLQKLLGKRNLASSDGLSWTLLRSSGGNGADDVEDTVEYHSKLHVALNVLHECFVTIVEPRTNSDLVADLLFNKDSDLRRLKFWGFYTIILEKGDEVVSVATFRVFDDKVAEMPLVGTRFQYRRMGMCRLLVNELEKLLSTLGVEKLLLPAVPQLLETWTTSFGFTKMTSSDRLELLDFTLLSFQDTTMCYKRLDRSSEVFSKPTGGDSIIDDEANRSVEQVEQIDNVNGNTISEVVDTVERIESFPTLCVDARFPSAEANATYSPPVSSCTDAAALVVHHVDDVAVDNCANSSISIKRPLPALEVSLECAQMEKCSMNSCNRESSIGVGTEDEIDTNVAPGAVNTMKYFYTRRSMGKYCSIC